MFDLRSFTFYASYILHILIWYSVNVIFPFLAYPHTMFLFSFHDSVTYEVFDLNVSYLLHKFILNYHAMGITCNEFKIIEIS